MVPSKLDSTVFLTRSYSSRLHAHSHTSGRWTSGQQFLYNNRDAVILWASVALM